MKNITKFILILLFVALGGFISYHTVINYRKNYSVEQDKEEFLSKIEQINQESSELEELKNFINDPDYQNREVKQKLDVKDKGETSIMLSPASVVENLSDEELIRILKDPNQEEIAIPLSNFDKWIAFFFDKSKLK